MKALKTLIGPSVTALFFLSGATSLAYQGIWFRRFTVTWGSSSLAMAAVVSSFLVGMAVGAYIAGKLARKIASPLKWYGILEVCIGVWALLVPLLVSWMSMSALGALSGLPSSSLVLFAVRSMIAFVIIGFPCICMGATLPLLVDFRCREQDSIGRATAVLYGVNTLGASVGCYLTGFHLLPALGSVTTNLSMALANIAVGAGAIVVSTLFSQTERPPAALETEVNEPGIRQEPPAWVFAASAATGWAALVLEMVWARQLANVLGGSTYVFTATLTVVLLGIAIGSLLYKLVEAHTKTRERLFELNASIIVAICSVTALGQMLIPVMCQVSGSLRGMRGSDMSNGLICTAIAVVLELGAAIAMGSLFPALAAAAKRGTASPANVVGSLYLWNTVGAGLGAIMASSLLVPFFGTVWTIVLAILGYLAALALLAIHASSVSVQRLLLVSAFGATVAFTLIRTDDPLAKNFGMYLYGRDVDPGSHSKLVYFQEGRSCNVLVTESSDGNRALRVNGKVDASTRGDQNTQLGCAYLPRFLHPESKNVCVIGLGSGTTAGASLLLPDTTVVCFEIEPAVYDASRYFSDINHSPWSSSRFAIVFDDARGALKRSRESYDLIISEPSNPWMAGVSSLYTLEFYEEAKQHLRSGGIVAQWVQTYNFTLSEFNLILRTIQSVFPHVALLRINRADTVVVASIDALTPCAKELDVAQGIVDSVSDIRKDLTTYFGTTDVRGLLLQHFVLDESGVRRLQSTDEDVVNTDINMRLEFDAPRQLFRERIPADQDVAIAITRAIRANWFERCIEEWKCSKAQAAQLADAVRNVVESGNCDGLEELITSCRGVAPNEVLFRVVDRAFDDTTAVDTIQPRSEVQALSPSMAEKAKQIGVLLWRQKKYEEGAKLFGELVAAFPQSATSWMNLAVNYRELGRHEEAVQASQRAMSIDPFNAFVERTLKSFEESKLEIRPQRSAESALSSDGAAH